MNQSQYYIDHRRDCGACGSKYCNWKEFTATVTGFDQSVQSTGNDRHCSFLDPYFVDATAHDFHLLSDSPAIATGTTDGVPVGELDLEGSPRVKSGKIDIGCYEIK